MVIFYIKLYNLYYSLGTDKKCLSLNACCLLLLDVFAIPRSREGFKGNGWFGSVKAQAAWKCHLSVTQVKMIKALFPNDSIKKALNGMPGDVFIVLEGKSQCYTADFHRLQILQDDNAVHVVHKDAGYTDPGQPAMGSNTQMIMVSNVCGCKACCLSVRMLYPSSLLTATSMTPIIKYAKV